jgi:L-cysteine S-thiosulfotransferase
MTTPPLRTLLASGLLLALVGCTAMPDALDLDRLTQSIVRASFRDQGIVKTSVLFDTDETNRLCSQADASGQALSEAQTRAIEESNLKAIRWPSDGQFLGDWRQGEAIAQSGVGLTWTDTAKTVNGGNCYNCHQIDPKEISYGTLGPSLVQYGKLRGVSDPNSAESRPIVEYTWGKIWNAKAYNACSRMPRAGHAGILTEAQVRHVMALLLAPDSPVNR